MGCACVCVCVWALHINIMQLPSTVHQLYQRRVHGRFDRKAQFKRLSRTFFHALLLPVVHYDSLERASTECCKGDKVTRKWLCTRGEITRALTQRGFPCYTILYSTQTDADTHINGGIYIFSLFIITYLLLTFKTYVHTGNTTAEGLDGLSC